MGIVLNQSLKNTIITYLGFAIGAVNTLYLYPSFLGSTYYAVTNYVLSAANVLMPLLAIGMQNTLVKYYAQYQTEKEKEQFLSFTIIFPLIACIPLLFIGLFFYNDIVYFVSKRNPILKNFIWLIPFTALCMAYFEIFYAWLRVHLHSVFGNFIKEVALRLFSFFSLLAIWKQWLTIENFVYITALFYFLAFVITMLYAFYIKAPVFCFKIPTNTKEILIYSFYIILSGGVANLLLDGDKMILNQYVQIENIAYYSVATYIALIISVPSKAMYQITYPITAQLMHENNQKELDVLYKKTSINLQFVGGLVMLCIFLNINKLYELVPAEYNGGLAVVFLIGFSKYIDLILGNNTAILFNSKYYKMLLILGFFLVIITVVLNMIFIPHYGILGSAFATLLSIVIYSWAKIVFVYKRMKLSPFTKKTIHSLLITLLFFIAFYFWDFPFHPIIAIGLKSFLIIVFYIYINYKMIISVEINLFLDNIFLKLKNIK